jgi:hypothetical protein
MVSAPGAQVNPALMGGMPPGANPNAHALQHLNPAQQQMFQQQQLQHCTCSLGTFAIMFLHPLTVLFHSR